MDHENESRISRWADVGAGFGLLLLLVGLWQWHQPVAWIVAGVATLVVSVFAAAPPKPTTTPETPDTADRT